MSRRRSAPAVSADVCTGCGQVRGSQFGRPLKQVIIGVSTTVYLCDGRQGLRPPGKQAYLEYAYVSATCLRRVRDKFQLCPGCGEEGQTPGTICDDCHASIERDHATFSEELHVYRVNTSYIMGQYLGGDRQKALERAARHLARAVAGHRYWQNGTGNARSTVGSPKHRHDSGLAADPCVELTESQAKALQQFSEIMEDVSAAIYEDGKEDGRNLLLGLARGEMTTADYEARLERRKGR